MKNTTSLIEALSTRLSTLQEHNGSFICTAVCDGRSRVSKNIFTTAMVASVLPHVESIPLINTITERSSEFLLAQQQKSGSWNYWQKDTDRQQKYPDDLDDTAISLAALLTHTPDSVTGAMMAHFAHILNACEHDEGGPYNTWITDWQYNTDFSDIDIAVNANIAYCLGNFGVQLPRLQELFATAIAEEDFYSEYYCTEAIICYFIARACGSNTPISLCKTLFSTICTSTAISSPSCIFDTACAVSALVLLSQHCTVVDYTFLDDAIDFLEKKIVHYAKEDFETPWYREQKTAEGVWYCTSEAVTMALCIQALHNYQNIEQKPSSDKKDTLYAAVSQRFLSTITYQPYRKSAQTLVYAAGNHQFMSDAVLLPFHIAEAYNAHISQSTLMALSVATLSGWVGYTLVDAIMDHQHSLADIPFALECIRSLQVVYTPYNHITGVLESLSVVEQALQKEYAARLTGQGAVWNIPHASEYIDQYVGQSIGYGNQKHIPLYEKTFGIALPIVVTATLAGCTAEHITSLLTFFQEYLSIRQRNDDAHDLINDISCGRQTPIVSEVLRLFQQKFPDRISVDITHDAPALLHIFWSVCFTEVCTANALSIETMKQQLSIIAVHNQSFFEKLIAQVTHQEAVSAREYQRIVSFLDTY